MAKNRLNLRLAAIVLAGMLSALGCDSASEHAVLDGIWQHSDKDAQIKFDLSTGLATVHQHGTHAENQGLTVIKEIVASEQAETWQGMMFDGYQNTYVPVTISLEDNRVEVRDSAAQVILTLTQ